MRQIVNGKEMVLGTCYYPEHWPENLWEEDLERMLECGIQVIRIAEFAWSKVEPYEGVFTYEFFDRFLDLAREKGMKVIFCTPTATPAGLADGEVSGGAQRNHRWGAVPPWGKAALQL